MIRIKEILKEKKMSVNDLADKLGVSRQALSRQIQGKMLIETAERIADALNVPLWQIFVSPSELLNTKELHAIVDYNGKLYKATSIRELEEIVNKLKSDEH